MCFMVFSRTKQLFLTIFATLVFVFAGYAQSGRVQATPTPTPEDDTVRIATEEIKLNVLAFDENGQFFRDVTARDLVISENNILHQPVSVRRLPANVLIIVDTGGEMRVVKSLDQTRKVARAVTQALRPDVGRLQTLKCIKLCRRFPAAVRAISYQNDMLIFE